VSETLAALLVALARVVPELLDALRPDVASDVRAALASARGRLPAPGSIRDAVDGVIARHHAAPRVSSYHASLLSRLAAPTSSSLLSHEERRAIAEVAEFIRASVDDGDQLAPPVIFDPPNHPED
jgi:hypothetical protein